MATSIALYSSSPRRPLSFDPDPCRWRSKNEAVQCLLSAKLTLIPGWPLNKDETSDTRPSRAAAYSCSSKRQEAAATNKHRSTHTPFISCGNNKNLIIKIKKKKKKGVFLFFTWGVTAARTSSGAPGRVTSYCLPRLALLSRSRTRSRAALKWLSCGSLSTSTKQRTTDLSKGLFLLLQSLCNFSFPLFLVIVKDEGRSIDQSVSEPAVQVDSLAEPQLQSAGLSGAQEHEQIRDQRVRLFLQFINWISIEKLNSFNFFIIFIFKFY